MATIEVDIIVVSNNLNSKNNFLDKSSGGKAVTLHTLYSNALRISRKKVIENNSYFSGYYCILDKSLEDRHATLHTFGKSVLQISRNANFLRKTSLNKEITFLRKVKSKANFFGGKDE